MIRYKSQMKRLLSWFPIYALMEGYVGQPYHVYFKWNIWVRKLTRNCE